MAVRAASSPLLYISFSLNRPGEKTANDKSLGIAANTSARVSARAWAIAGTAYFFQISSFL